MNLKVGQDLFAPAEVAVVLVFIPERGQKGLSFPVLVNHDHIDRVVAGVAGQDRTEVVGRVHRFAVDGDQRVPRFHPRLVCTAVHHDTLNVNVILLCRKLRGQTAKQDQHHKCSKEIGGGAGSKHAEALSTGRTHQFIGLGFMQRPPAATDRVAEDRTNGARMPCPRASRPCPNSWMTNDTTNATAPHPNGITGLSPGTATNSLAEGEVAVGGEMSEVMNANNTTRPTISMETEQTHSETSPYALQNDRGRHPIEEALPALGAHHENDAQGAWHSTGQAYRSAPTS